MACNLRRFFLAAALFAAWTSSTAVAAQAEAIDSVGSDVIPAVVDDSDADIALIEFLGQWETDDGEWIAPSDLADEMFVELIETVNSVEIEEID